MQVQNSRNLDNLPELLTKSEQASFSVASQARNEPLKIESASMGSQAINAGFKHTFNQDSKFQMSDAEKELVSVDVESQVKMSVAE